MAESKAWVDAYKSGKACMDCGGRFAPEAMEFDHRPGEEKAGSISNLRSQSKSIKVLMAEIEKCDLVCANCHRVRTFARWRATLDTEIGEVT